jgi:hypothetical protein
VKNTETWQKLYRLSAELYALAPWTTLEETEIFAVKTIHSGKTYFVSIMGHDGSFRAMSAYEESMALGQFWDLQENASVDSGDVLTIAHLILSFGSAEETDAMQLEKIRETGTDFGFTEEWPEFKKVVPGFLPEQPEGQTLDDLADILQQALHVCARAMRDPDFIHPGDKEDDVYLFREFTGKGENKSWHDKYRKVALPEIQYKITYKKSDLHDLQALPLAQVVHQAAFQILPLPVRQEDGRACFPFVVLIVNKKTGAVESYNMLTPMPDYGAMLGGVPGEFIGFIRTMGFRPRTIEVKNPLLFEMLHEPLQQCGIHVVFTNQLQATEKAIEYIVESMKKQRG